MFYIELELMALCPHGRLVFDDEVGLLLATRVSRMSLSQGWVLKDLMQRFLSLLPAIDDSDGR